LRPAATHSEPWYVFRRDRDEAELKRVSRTEFRNRVLRIGGLFLDRPDVDATNYRAEQAIRPAVINRKPRAGTAHLAALVLKPFL
jgi:hypothetical protein